MIASTTCNVVQFLRCWSVVDIMGRPELNYLSILGFGDVLRYRGDKLNPCWVNFAHDRIT